MAATPALATERPVPRWKTASQPPVAPQPAPPAAALPLEQMPASPPQVTFQNGMLTISAHNSTLGDILRAVHARTGADVDVPPNATERVVVELGPGPARDILASLLNGSHFNYVMLGSATNPHALDRVILTAKGATSPSDTNRPAAFTPPPQPSAQADADDADDASDTETDEDDADAQDETPAADGDQPQQVQQVAPGQVVPGQALMPGQNPRTPEQILQELRNRQQGGQPGVPPGQPNGDGSNPPQPPPN